MSHRQHPAGHVLQAFHDGELDAATAAEVASHSEHCAQCRNELAELEQVGRLLVDAPAPELPRTVWHRVRPGRPQESRLKPAFGFAACAAGIALGVLLGPIQFNAETTASEMAWSETVTVWDGGASASLLNVYQYEQE